MRQTVVGTVILVRCNYPIAAEEGAGRDGAAQSRRILFSASHLLWKLYLFKNQRMGPSPEQTLCVVFVCYCHHMIYLSPVCCQAEVLVLFKLRSFKNVIKLFVFINLILKLNSTKSVSLL